VFHPFPHGTIELTPAQYFGANTVVSREQIPLLLHKEESGVRERPIARVLKKYAIHFLVGTLSVGTAIPAFVFNKQASEQFDDEQEVYDYYAEAPAGSDFETLWAAVEEERDKTDALLEKRNVFGYISGGLGAALVFSLAIEF